MESIDGAEVSPELQQFVDASQVFRGRQKDGRSREQIAFDLIQLRHLIDQAEIEFAEDAALLARSDLWSDWGSTSPIHWIRHYCKTSSSVAAAVRASSAARISRARSRP